MAGSQVATRSVQIGDDIAQALWAAMWDDDQLANDYVDYAICHALDHLVSGGFIGAMPRERRARVRARLEAARARLHSGGDEAADRWHSYLTPF